MKSLLIPHSLRSLSVILRLVHTLWLEFFFFAETSQYNCFFFNFLHFMRCGLKACWNFRKI